MYIHLLAMRKTLIPELFCMCASLRRAARALTQHYEAALRPLGLKATQFTILQALSISREISQGQLGEILAIDSTTLTRTLEIMGRRGWISKQPGKDRRERRISLAKAGEIQLRRAMPLWEKVQAQLRDRLGNERWQDLLKATNNMTSLVTD